MTANYDERRPGRGGVEIVKRTIPASVTELVPRGRVRAVVVVECVEGTWGGWELPDLCDAQYLLGYEPDAVRLLLGAAKSPPIGAARFVADLLTAGVPVQVEGVEPHACREVADVAMATLDGKVDWLGRVVA